MANSKFDKEVERMQYLMTYDNSLNEHKSEFNPVEYHTEGADGKIYGIIREGNAYYIKSTEKGKENIAESYDYVHGTMYRKEDRANSFNKASKMLEQKLMSLNESYGIHKDVSIVDFSRHQKTMTNLTEAARAELDRMHSIFENSNMIGKDNTGDPESKGTASDPVKQGEPFTDAAKAELDKDMKENGTVEGATEHDKVKDADKQLQNADKMEKGKRGDEDYTDAHDDLEGESVADQHPSGGKVVKVNESMYEEDDLVGTEGEDEFETGLEEVGDEGIEDMEFEEPDQFEGEPEMPFEEEGADEAAYMNNDEQSLDELLEEFMSNDEEVVTESEENLSNANKDCIVNGDETLNGPHGSMEAISTDGGVKPKQHDDGEDKALKGRTDTKYLDVQCADKLNESIERVTEKVYNKILEGCNKKSAKKETLEEAVLRIVKEEATKLGIWGKHPKYRQQPMTTPDNKEVLAGTAEKDWNDDSAKGNQPYGQKIGNGAPFDQQVEVITDAVVNMVKEAIKNSKK